MKRSKRYNQIATKVKQDKKYSVDDAIKAAVETSTTKFDSSIDVQVVMNLTEKQKKESIKGTLNFPNIIGVAPKVAVIADLTEQKEAEKAGADFVGLDDLVDKIEKGWVGFDVLIATPKVMPKIAKLGKVIGSKGLMPNPKNDTVTNDITRSVKSYKSGKTVFKMSENGVINIRIAKAKMPEKAIKENFSEFITSLNEIVKKLGDNPYKSVTMKSSMGPNISLDSNSLS